VKLTPSTIRSLTLPEGVADRTFFDSDLAGFGVRIRASGSRGYVVQYKFAGRHRRIPLGSITEIDLGKARATAKDLLARVRLGQDPFAEKLEARAAAGETLGSRLPEYLAHKAAALRPRTMVEIRRHLLVQAAALHPRSLHSIDRREVAGVLASIEAASGPVAANRLHESLRAFFGWARRAGLVEANPAAEMNRAAETSRDRVISGDELHDIWQALGDDRYGDIIQLLALTGTRREEIGGLRWSEVDLDRAMIVLPPARTKAGVEHRIPLSAPVLAILEARAQSGTESVFGYRDGTSSFSDWSGSKRALDQRIAAARKAAGRPAMAPWRVHDLRRMFSTMLHGELGIEPHIVEALLGHVQGGIASVYNRATYDGAKAAALAQWADHVMAIVGRRGRKVLPLRRGA